MMRFSYFLFVLSPIAVQATIDLAGDGMDDIWQLRYQASDLIAGSDADGDGFSNSQESSAGTDPRDAQDFPAFGMFQVSNESVEITCATVAGKHYQVEAANTLQTWEGVTAFTGDGTIQELMFPANGEQRFYRIRVADQDTDKDGVSDYAEILLSLDPADATTNASAGGDMLGVISKLTTNATFPLGNQTVTGAALTPEQASRFLTHATHGVEMESITELTNMGYSAWLDAQLAAPYDLTLPTAEFYQSFDGPNYWNVPLSTWWKSNLTSQALLRHRIANAFAEIFVISSDVVFNYGSQAQFYDTLLQHSFGNFRDFLSAISLQPAMGVYLSHLGNAKANPETGSFPDENFAREVMQLFSIGLFELNTDGSLRLNEEGRSIPTYSNEHIKAFARVFTGVGVGSRYYDDPTDENLKRPMRVFDTLHDTDAKTLLTYPGAPNGGQIPSFDDDPGRTAMDDFNDAMDNLFHHPNVGPFIGYRLIQRLVTSNPSPEYIERVALTFNDNGQGVRGDLTSVVRAILLDKEARSLPSNAPFQGRLREPYLRKLSLTRILGSTVETGEYDFTDWIDHELFGQKFLSSPSVFNFFLPSYQPKGPILDAGRVAPEFQVHNDSTLLSMQNAFRGYFQYAGLGNSDIENRNVRFDWADEQALADDPAALIDHLNLVFAAGQLSEQTQTIIEQAVASLPAGDRVMRLSMALRLIQISPDYCVIR